MQKELGDDGIVWLSVCLFVLMIFIGQYAFSNDNVNIEKKKEYLEASEYAKGVQISLSLSRNMIEDPYFVNGERFYKMRITLRYLESALALGVFFSFFLPWTAKYLSAYELLKLDNFESILSLIFVIPFFSLLLMFSSKFHKIQSFLSIIFGLFSFLLIKILMNTGKFEEIPFVNFSHGFYIYLFLSILLIVLPIYKIFKETTLLNKKKIAFNSKLLKPWLAFGLFSSFFLPWLNFEFSYLSAYALLLDETYRERYWFLMFIPLLSIILFLYSRFNLKLKVISFLTGITSYLAILFGMSRTDEDFLTLLSLGAYISLLLGAGLIFLSLRKIIKTNNK
jgi:hypothetical protein